MQLLDVDPWTGVREYVSYDETRDALTIHRVQDVEPIIDRNKELQNDMSHWKNQAKNDEHGIDMRLIASIPVIVIEKWMREGINAYNKNHWPEVKRKLNDPDYWYLRCAHVTL